MRHINSFDIRGGTKIKKTRVKIGITTVLVSAMTLSIVVVDKNIKAITPRGDMREVLSLVKVKDAMISMAQETIEDNKL